MDVLHGMARGIGARKRARLMLVPVERGRDVDVLVRVSRVGSIVDGLVVELDEVLDVGFRVAGCRFQARVQPRLEFALRSSFGCRSL
jgi:hypothetical protein